MSSHHHCDGHHHPSVGEKSLQFAIVLTLTFMFVEAVAGFWANSLALLSDALHMFTDSGALLLAWFALWLSKKPRSRNKTFGYRRAETLGALANGLAIWFLAGFMVFEAFERIKNPREVNAEILIGVSAIGFFVNLIVMRVLHSSQKESLNLKAAYLHVLGDLLGSLGGVSSGLIILFTGALWMDPVVSLMIAALILFSSWKLVWESIGILMHFAPKGFDSLEIQEALENLEHVTSVHDLHLWNVSSREVFLSAHLVTDRGEEVLSEACCMLRDQYGIGHCTLQIESPGSKLAKCGAC